MTAMTESRENELIRAWVTTYALTHGIQVVDAEVNHFERRATP